MGTYLVESLNCIYIIQTVQIIWSLFMVYHLYNFYHSHESKDSIRTEVHHLLHGVWVNFTRRTDTRHILDHTLNAGFTEPVSTGSLHWFMEGGQTDGAEVLPVKIRAERSIIAPRALSGSGHLRRTKLAINRWVTEAAGAPLLIRRWVNSISMHPIFNKKL